MDREEALYSWLGVGGSVQAPSFLSRWAETYSFSGPANFPVSGLASLAVPWQGVMGTFLGFVARVTPSPWRFVVGLRVQAGDRRCPVSLRLGTFPSVPGGKGHERHLGAGPGGPCRARKGITCSFPGRGPGASWSTPPPGPDRTSLRLLGSSFLAQVLRGTRSARRCVSPMHKY